MFRLLARSAFVLWILAVFVLSVVPPSLRPVTSASHTVEHLAAFVLTGLLLGLGFPGLWLRRAALLVAAAGAIELLQIWRPGRHATPRDFLIDAGGALVGLGISMLVARRRGAGAN